MDLYGRHVGPKRVLGNLCGHTYDHLTCINPKNILREQETSVASSIGKYGDNLGAGEQRCHEPYT